MNEPCLINTNPPVYVNDRWLLHNSYLKQIVSETPDHHFYKNFVEPSDAHKTKNNTALSQQSFLHIVSETVYCYPSTYITEKTIKPILSKRPFVLVAPPGSLEHLKELGFKTFHDYWDESYDSITDPETRLLAIVDIIEWICKQPIDYVQNLCLSMSDVLNYNYNFYTDHFKFKELEKLENACLENLKPRYD